MWASVVSGTEREEGRAVAGPAWTELGRLREGWAVEDGPAEAREEQATQESATRVDWASDWANRLE